MEPILFFATSFPHHGQYSGYHQLALHWPDPKCIYYVKPPIHHARNWWFLHRVYSGINDIQTIFQKKDALRIANEKGCSIIHCLYGETDLPFTESPRGYKLVATLHQPIPHLSRSKQRVQKLKEQLRNVDLCLTVSRELGEFVKSINPEIHTRFIPHGVDTTFFDCGHQEREHSVLISCGWYRNIPLTKLVIGSIYQLDPTVKFLAFGSSSMELNDCIPNIEILRNLSDEQLRKHYQTCGVVFIPLEFATANNALLEALACGAAVIAPEISGVVDYIGQNETLYSQNATEKQIGLHILHILNSPSIINNSYWRRIGEKFSWFQIINQVQEAYETITCL